LSWLALRAVGKRRQRLLARVQHKAPAKAARTPLSKAAGDDYGLRSSLHLLQRRDPCD
jgi:hypothetical protein